MKRSVVRPASPMLNFFTRLSLGAAGSDMPGRTDMRGPVLKAAPRCDPLRALLPADTLPEAMEHYRVPWGTRSAVLCAICELSCGACAGRIRPLARRRARCALDRAQSRRCAAAAAGVLRHNVGLHSRHRYAGGATAWTRPRLERGTGRGPPRPAGVWLIRPGSWPSRRSPSSSCSR